MNWGRFQILRTAASRLLGREKAQGAILLYHRVAHLESDPWGLAVTPEIFSEQMGVLRECARPVALGDLHSKSFRGDGTKPRVAVTFDDGYSDNFTEAKPRLEECQIPATFFITSGGWIQSEFWWDSLQRVVLTPGTLPERLEIEVGEARFCKELGAARFYSESEHASSRHWQALLEPPPTVRHQLFLELYHWLGRLAPEVRDRAVEQLVRWSGSTARASLRAAMTPEQIQQLARSELFEIGGHTVTHPFLSRIPAFQQRQEITRNKAQLQALIDCPVEGFAYPHGDSNPEAIASVKAAGYKIACTTVHALVKSKSPPLQWPRFVVGNWNGEQFAAKLREWGISNFNFKSGPPNQDRALVTSSALKSASATANAMECGKGNSS